MIYHDSDSCKLVMCICANCIICTVGTVHTHMVAGALGGFLTGIFATVEGCAAFGVTNPGGAIAGNGKQVWLQIVGALFIIGLNLFMTSLIMVFIQYVLRIPLRMKEADLDIGDDAVHGEEAYALFFEGERSHMSLHAGDMENAAITEGRSIQHPESGNGHESPVEAVAKEEGSVKAQ